VLPPGEYYRIGIIADVTDLPVNPNSSPITDTLTIPAPLATICISWLENEMSGGADVKQCICTNNNTH